MTFRHTHTVFCLRKIENVFIHIPIAASTAFTDTPQIITFPLLFDGLTLIVCLMSDKMIRDAIIICKGKKCLLVRPLNAILETNLKTVFILLYGSSRSVYLHHASLTLKLCRVVL